MYEEPLKCEFMNYQITGEALIQAWGGGTGIIKMEPRNSNSLYLDMDIKNNINDNGFGSESILAARVQVYKCYQHGAKVFHEEFYFDPLTCSKEVPEKYIQMFESYDAMES